MIWQSIILGITQGFTEFLPISSSGHLVIMKESLGISTPGAFFESILHLGTMSAVIVYFYKKIFSLDLEAVKMLIIATVPIAIVGILLKGPIESLFSSTKIVGVALFFTALVNFYIDKYDGRKTNIDSIDSIFIGIAQAFAIIPGISRSGTTIFVAKYLKIDAEKAAEFSFLISLPAIAGANILQFYSHGYTSSGQSVMFYIVGFLAAFVTGMFAINIMLKLVVSRNLKFFSFYCLLLGIFAIFFA